MIETEPDELGHNVGDNRARVGLDRTQELEDRPLQDARHENRGRNPQKQGEGVAGREIPDKPDGCRGTQSDGGDRAPRPAHDRSKSSRATSSCTVSAGRTTLNSEPSTVTSAGLGLRL